MFNEFQKTRVYSMNSRKKASHLLMTGLLSFMQSRPSLWPPALQERLQLPRSRRMAEFAQRLRFDLADAFARDGEVLADLFERVLAAVRPQAEAHLDDLLLARRKRLQNFLRDFAEVDVDDGLGRVLDGLVLDKIAEVRIFLFADRGLQ